MTTQTYTKTLSGDKIKTEITLRSHTYVTQSIKISTLDSVDEFRNSLPVGWEIEKQYKTTIRIRKNKLPYEVFTDKVWLTLARMGFTEIGDGRSTCIPFLDEYTNRLIDFFAKDDETVVFVKCFDSSSMSEKELREWYQDYNGKLISRLYSATRNIYGKDCDLKIKVVVFCSDVLPPNTSPQFADKPEVNLYDSKHLDYFSSLVSQLKTAARYQFLAYLFPNQKIKNLYKKVFATKGKMGNRTFYTFMLHPNDLLKISFVAHKASQMSDDVRAYQRMLKPNRLRHIAEFINNRGKFPTNIVVNLKSNKNSKLQFDKHRELDDYTSLGELHLPSNYASAWIIDGQHRLYGYAYALETEKIKNDKSLLPVMAFDNLPEEEEMNMFIDLNSRQVKVPPQILVELYADLHWKSNDPLSAYQALISRLILKLNSVESSPLYERMIISGTAKSECRNLGLESMSVGFKDSRLIGSKSRDKVSPGPFSTDSVTDYSANLDKSFDIITRLFNRFREQLPEFWNPDNALEDSFTYLCTNIGIRALLHTFSDIAHTIESSQNVNLNQLNVDEIINKFRPYIDVLTEYFKNTPPSELVEKWNISSSSAGLVVRHSRLLGVIIHNNLPEFNPDWINSFLEDENRVRRISCFESIRKIENRLNSFIVATIKSEFGNDRNVWFVQGVPIELRRVLSQRREDGDRQRDEEKHLYLVEYIDICRHNWSIFRNSIPLALTSDIDNSKVATKWISKLDDIRNKVSHVTGEEVTRDNVAYVKEISSRVEHYLRLPK